MTREEAINRLKEARSTIQPFRYVDEAIDYAIQALEQETCQETSDTILIHTQGLEEGIRCAMCTNPIKSDRGCDGGCSVNETIYKKVIEVIDNQIAVQPIRKRDDVLDKIRADVINIADDRRSISVRSVIKIIDKYKAESEVKE